MANQGAARPRACPTTESSPGVPCAAVRSGSTRLLIQGLGSGCCLLRTLADILLPLQEGTSGKTALHLAVETQERGLVQFLLQAGARVDARMLNGCTPLHLAAGRGLSSISSTLCEAGADSLLRNVEDETPQDLAEDVRGIYSALLSRTSHTLPHPPPTPRRCKSRKDQEVRLLGCNL